MHVGFYVCCQSYAQVYELYVPDLRYCAKNPFVSAAQKNLRKIVTQILSELDPKEETVLRQRFGMSTNKTSTLEEVGEYIGVTRERIRQIEQKALNKLKHPTRARKLRSFLED